MRMISAVVLSATVLLSSCGTGSSGESPPPSTTSPVAASASVTVSAVAAPVCPAVQNPPASGCSPRPVTGATIIATGSQGEEAATGITGADGSVVLRLPPGSYTVVPQPVEGLLGTAPAVDIVLAESETLQVQVEYDTGIR